MLPGPRSGAVGCPALAKHTRPGIAVLATLISALCGGKLLQFFWGGCYSLGEACYSLRGMLLLLGEGCYSTARVMLIGPQLLKYHVVGRFGSQERNRKSSKKLSEACPVRSYHARSCTSVPEKSTYPNRDLAALRRSRGAQRACLTGGRLLHLSASG
jgi:hypothetical protein